MTEAEHQEELRRSAEEKLGPPVYVPYRDRIPREDAVFLRKLGYSLHRIADYYGVSHMTIWRIIKVGKITFPPLEIGKVKVKPKRVKMTHTRRPVKRRKVGAEIDDADNEGDRSHPSDVDAEEISTLPENHQ